MSRLRGEKGRGSHAGAASTVSQYSEPEPAFLIACRSMFRSSLYPEQAERRILTDTSIGLATAAQDPAMVSSANPRVRGPKQPIATTTIAILAAMNRNTPGVPKRFSKNAMMKPVKIVDRRLKE